MNLSSKLKDLEELTSNAKQIQDDLLEEILRVNRKTEYLGRFLQGSSDKELFKKNVPVVTYEDIKVYIERVANGEPSDVLSGEPITHFFLSSGTTGAKRKIFPSNNKFLEKRSFREDLRLSILSKHINGVEEGKVMAFVNVVPLSKAPCGLPVAPVNTCFIMSDYFKNRSPKCFTSPDQVILCVDNKQSTYCHLLCALVQREDVFSVFSSYAYPLVQAIKFLETHWKELCSNIRYGHVSEWITDLGCRDSVSNIILKGPNPEAADLIEQECSQKTWEGIITRLWPNVKFVHSVITGQMSQYIPILEFYCKKVPLISMTYGASETFLGINVNPLCKPQDISYTFMPNISYFEFQDARDHNEIVDLVDVKLGRFYEPLITNQSGLYRYRLGDILQVTGFYNSAPQFRFVCRNNVVLSVHVEETTEQDLLKALNQARTVLESSCLILMGFTCYSDTSTRPGHYVLYWELKSKKINGIVKLDDKVMVECCCVMEESLDVIYKKSRSGIGSIGALEIRVVQQGTFNCLMEHYTSNGVSSNSYKTPLCIKSPEVLAILEDKVLARFFSDKKPNSKSVEFDREMVCRKKKSKICDKVSHQEDRISRLPDALICDNILCHLPTEEAIKTSVLSARWRNLWKCVPGLDLGPYKFSNFDAFVSFVERFFHSNTESWIRKLRLSFGSCHGMCDFTSWIDAVTMRRIQHLDVNRIGPEEREIPLSLYTCETLVHLHSVMLMTMFPYRA